MKVLVLGGTGFIGRSLVSFLSRKTEVSEIHIVDNYSRPSHSEDDQNGPNQCNNLVIDADLSDNESFKNLDKDYDLVFLLASVVGVNMTMNKPEEVIRINSEIILNTLDWLKNSRCQRLIFTSTSETYAGTIEEFNWEVPTSENVPLTISEITHPRFSYAVTKMLGEAAFSHYANAYNFTATIVRYHNVYGPNMGFRHVIPHLAQRFYNQEDPFAIYGADQTRAFCHIDDAVEGTVLAALNDQQSSPVEIFHIGNDEEITIEDLVKFSGDYFGYKGSYTYEKTFPGSVQRRCPDISKSKTILDFYPSISWKDGVHETLEWYKSFFESNRNASEDGFSKP